MRRVCAWCGDEEGELQRCSRCKSVFYCSRDHQKLHFKLHREECHAIKIRLQFEDRETQQRSLQIEELTKERGNAPIVVLPAPFNDAFIAVPPIAGPNNNLLILLHGYGDSDLQYAKFAASLQIPQTLCIALRAPNPLVDLGWHWFPLHDSVTGRELPQDDETRVATLHMTVDSLITLVHHFVEKGWLLNHIFMFGFSQGGQIALEVGKQVALGGVVSISGTPIATPCENPNTTPVLITHGENDAIVPIQVARQLSESVYGDVLKVFPKGHEMINSREEMTCVLTFLAGKLYRTMEGMEEVGMHEGVDLVDIVRQYREDKQ